jgi:general L-amino acid transport system substrate-binding protein
VILPERISKEPLAAVVRDGDREWEMLVRWVFHALVGAEEVGVTGANIDASGLQSRSTSWGLISGNDTRIAQALGVPGDWALRAVRAVGNYGEVYERNLGAASDLGIERGPNRIWTQGGLHYAPPLE